MLFGGGMAALLVAVLWIYCILDVIQTDESLMRNMPKVLWLIVVLFFPLVGSIAWLVAGRPVSAGLSPGSTERRPPSGYRPRAPRGPVGPEDSADFMREAEERRLRAWEEELRRREEELRRRERGEDDHR